MNITILGNGYVGKDLYETLSKYYNVSIHSKINLNYHDKNILSDYLKTNKINLVIGSFGFTGRPNIDEAEIKKPECWNLNVQIPLLVNMICADLKIPYTHISTGCVYNNYTKKWDETDIPNFGLFHPSSFYVKSKHAFELISDQFPNTLLRIRLPFSSNLNEDRNLLNKLLKYDNLIDFCNSKTYLGDLSFAIKTMIDDGTILSDKKQLFHMVNPHPLTTTEIISEMKKYGLQNKNWNIIELDKLKTITPKSNCIITTIYKNNPMINALSELEALQNCLKSN